VGGQIAMTTGDGTVLASMIAWSNHDRGGMPTEDPCRRATARTRPAALSAWGRRRNFAGGRTCSDVLVRLGLV